MTPPPLILASQSERRRELLGRLGVPFEVAPAHVDETSLPGEKPLDYVRRVALAKAATVAAKHAEACVLACDTPVVLGRRIIQTPHDAGEATEMLRLQSGRRVHTPSVIVARMPTGEVYTETVDAWVKFKPLTAAEIGHYAHRPEPEWRGVAGGWRIQGLAAAWIIDMRGSASGVMGLPLYQTAKLLRKAGYKILGN
jgi:septum formation protein